MSLSEKLPKRLTDYLDQCGIKTPEQAIATSDSHYLRVMNLSRDCIFSIKSVAASLLLPGNITNAYQVYDKEISLGKLTTGCEIIDNYLCGGLRVGTITEIFGESGCGKTQIALQIAANCWKIGAVYISTEDVFPTKRLQQMFCNINNRQHSKQDVSKYGEKIFILELIELEELKRCINIQLPRLLDANRTISLVVIDSIAAPFRPEFQNDMKTRALHLKEIGMTLMNLAVKYDLAVLCINQVLSTMEPNNSDVIPCLGLTWSNLLTSRIKVQKTERYCRVSAAGLTSIGKRLKHCEQNDDLVQIRQMKIIASPELPNIKTVEYIIAPEGVLGLNITR